MIITKKYFILIFLLASPVFLFAQTPTVIPLDHNPALRDRKPTLLKNGIQPDTVSLPFFDDFSYYSRSSQPDYHLWMDQYVYINNSYPIQPRSNGVATFDALDANGNVYNSATATFPADTLTSCPIDLGENGINNVYLSFFYQPGGYGDSPEEGDSLILQFKSPVTKHWRTVWHIPGTSVHPFKQVILPVNGEYLYKGFQFRFVNLVSLDPDIYNLGRKGNCDHWHIDYVHLDKNRSDTDSAYFDVAVTAPMKTLIKGYQSIPWKQLPDALPSKTEQTIELTYRNNDNIKHLVYINFTRTDVYNNMTYSLPTDGTEIEAGETMTFNKTIVSPFESLSVDSALFEFKGYLITDEFDRKENDTVCLRQSFNNYFARDDGVPESGYGFFGEKTQGCAVACRYETFSKVDTLKAIRIYFNPTINNVTGQYRFKIAVWRDNEGRPGEQVYISSTVYSPKITGQFVQYDLDHEVYVTKNKDYWIGWVQVTSGFLNVGFDRNYNDRGNLWYNNGSWRRDVNNGTLMIRPVMGKRKDFATSVEMPEMVMDVRMKLYPNPASQYVRIELESLEPAVFSDYMVEIYDVNGRLYHCAPYTGKDTDVSDYNAGLYFVRLIHRKSGHSQTQKLIVE